MRFQITRTSAGYYHEEKPCEGAFVYKRERDSNLDDQDRLSWALEVNTLGELLQLIEKVGDSVIISRACDYQDGLPQIEIYDDYRE